MDRDAERRKDDDVLRLHLREIELTLTRQQNLDSHVAQSRVHVRIVNDLTDEIDAAIGKLAARLVGVFHRALDAVAEPEFARQTDRDVAHREGVILRLHAVHQASAVVRGEFVLDLGLEAETLSEIGTWVGCRHAES